MPEQRVFTGFGLGAIQAGLFLAEAQRSGNFSRLVVAEVQNDVVDAVRADGGVIAVNVAGKNGVVVEKVTGVEIYNPREQSGADALVKAVAASSEIATALPGVDFYDDGTRASVASLLAEGIRKKLLSSKPFRCVVYTAENDNAAAEKLREKIIRRLDPELAGKLDSTCDFLNTVIGKMSGIAVGVGKQEETGLEPMNSGSERAALVEEFNRIFISAIKLPDFHRGITVFEEKPELLPFEEAKLYGHNATHALIGFLALRRGFRYISEAGSDAELMKIAADAFLLESGAALCKKYAGFDPLFTPEGYRAYAEDLFERMLNPHLRDTVSRVTRDPERKLGWNDRLLGVVRLCIAQGIKPWRYALGAAAAVDEMSRRESLGRAELLDRISTADDAPPESESAAVLDAVREAFYLLDERFPLT